MPLQQVNELDFLIAEEDPAIPGSLPNSPAWHRLQVNGGVEFGAQVQTQVREYIDEENQRSEGTSVGVTSAFTYEGDATMEFLRYMSEAFTWSRNANRDLSFRGADVTSASYSVGQLSSSAIAKLRYSAGGPTSLLYAKGYAIEQNNGLKPLGQAASGTTLRASGLAVESAPSGATLEIAGIRGSSGGFSLTVNNDRTGTLNHAGLDFRTLGLYPQQLVHIGRAGGTNSFVSGMGYARVVSVSNGSIALDNCDESLSTDNGAGRSVDLIFDGFVRAVSVRHADYFRPSYTIELAYSELGAGGTPQYSYSVGNRPNQMVLTLEPKSRITARVSFVGLDTRSPTSQRENGADNPISPIRNLLVNTTRDIARLRVRKADETGFHTDFQRLSFTQGNNITTSDSIGTEEVYSVNKGTLTLDTDSVIYLTSPDVIEAIREYQTVKQAFTFKNADGVFHADIGSLKMAGGGLELRLNEPVRINATGQAHRDGDFGTTVAYSWLPFNPQAS